MEAVAARKELPVLPDWTRPFHIFPDREFVATVGLFCPI
jgi:hypothetical protein